MKFKFILITVIILSTNLTNVFAQNKLVDSLLHKLSIAKNDTIKIKIFNQLSDVYTKTKPDSSITYVKKAFKLSEALSKSNDEDITAFVKKSNSVSYTNLGNSYKALGDNLLALDNYKKSVKILREINDKRALANNYTDIGIIKYLNGRYIVAEDYYNKAIKIHEELNNESGLAYVYRNLGNVYLKEGDYPLSIKYYQKSLEISEKINDLNSAARCYNNIGYIHTETHRYVWAIEYLEKSLKIKEKIGDKRGVATAYNNIGNVYLEQKDYESALKYYNKSLKIRRVVKAKRHVAFSLQNIGKVYIGQKNYAEAEVFLLNSLKIYKEVEESEQIGELQVQLSSLKIKQRNYKEAIKFADSALVIALDLKALPMQRDCYQFLAESFENKGNLTKAYNFLKQYSAIKDGISDQTAQKLIESETRYKVGKKQKEIETQKLKLETQEVEAKNREIKMYFSLIALLLMIVLALVFYRNYKQKNKANKILNKQKEEIQVKNEKLYQQKEEIEAQMDVVILQKDKIEIQKEVIQKKNIQITDSINYAQHIQESVFLSESEIKKHFKDSFLINQPKDIVSGDFFWFAEINNKKIFAVIDCTGHGVPGAIISMIGNSLLNEIVKEKNIHEPSEILNTLHSGVMEVLHQGTKQSKADDGMDMVICVLDIKSKELLFSGARNFMYLKNGTGLEILNGDPFSIGGIPYLKKLKFKFNTHKLQVENGTKLYLMTDGYMDQFGGPKNKKFNQVPFEEMLNEISDLPMSEQKEKLLQTFTEWQGSNKQIDDVMVLGLQLG